MQFKPLHGLAPGERVGHQVQVEGAILELDGVPLPDQGSIQPFISDEPGAEKSANFFEAEHEALHCVQYIVLAGIQQAYRQREFDFPDVHVGSYLMGFFYLVPGFPKMLPVL